MSEQVADMVRRVLNEEKMPVAVAARLCGEYTGGSRLHPSTVVRWINRGVRLADGRRVKLDAVKFGSKLITSRQAIERFLAETTAGGMTGGDTPRTPAARNRASEDAARQLQAVGI